MAGNAVTFWGRVGDAASAEANAFLRRHGYRPDRVLDIDRAPPTTADLAQLRLHLGSLRPLAPSDAAPHEEQELAAWLAADPKRMRTPILLTPKGALVGFRERSWTSFLGIGPLRGG